MMPAREIRDNINAIMLKRRGHRPRLEQEISSSDVSNLNPIWCRVTQVKLAGKLDIGRRGANRR